MRSSHRNTVIRALIAALLISTAVIAAPKSKGRLLIIGGGERTEEIMKRFVELAGGANARIVVFPMASSVPDEVGKAQAEEMLKLGAKESFYLKINAEEANRDSVVAKLDGVTGVFYSGGDQVFLTAALLNTKTQQRVEEIYRSGGVVGGTSAGAAVMSRIMITGNELLNKDTTGIFFTLLKGNVETKEGFGFVTEAVIDQHFVVRKRHNRLISIVLQNPQLVGVGIDESTCIIVHPDRSFEVLGESVVMVYDATKAKRIRTNKNEYLSAEGMGMHILQSGDRYDLLTKKPLAGKR